MGIGTIPVVGIVLVSGAISLVSLLVGTFDSIGPMAIEAVATLGLGLVLLSAAYFLRIRTALVLFPDSFVDVGKLPLTLDS